MTYAIFVINSNGSVLKSTQLSAPKLDQMQAAVAGWIETIPGFTKFTHEGKTYTRGKAFANEEGLLHGLPYNHRATQAWQDCLTNRLGQDLVCNVIFYAKEH